MLTLYIAGSVAAILVLRYYYVVRSRFCKLAEKIPGRPTIPILGNSLPYLRATTLDLLPIICKEVSEFGGTARQWLGDELYILISKPEDIEICLNSGQLIEKSKMYSVFHDFAPLGLFTAPANIWRRHRKVIGPTFHPNIIKGLIPTFEEDAKILIQRLEDLPTKHCQPFDIYPYIRDCAFDIICQSALNFKFETQKGKNRDMMHHFERIMTLMTGRFFTRKVLPDFFYYLTKDGKEYLKHKEELRKLFLVIKGQQELALNSEDLIQSNRGKNFFQAMMNLIRRGEGLSDKEFWDEMYTLLAAGFETSTGTMANTVLMLGIHQDVQSKVYQEAKLLQDRLRGRTIEDDDLKQLYYLEMVIKETMRMYPIGAFMGRHATEDVQLASCLVPKGADVLLILQATFHDPSIWEKPEKFDPDNFLPEKQSKRHPYSFVPFSGGPRGCIGKNYAYTSIKIMLYHIITKFKIICDLKMEDIQMKAEITQKKVGGHDVRLEPRVTIQ